MAHLGISQSRGVLSPSRASGGFVLVSHKLTFSLASQPPIRGQSPEPCMRVTSSKHCIVFNAEPESPSKNHSLNAELHTAASQPAVH
jgi:hypothetical protein